jgi:hypothetical protein
MYEWGVALIKTMILLNDAAFVSNFLKKENITHISMHTD